MFSDQKYLMPTTSTSADDNANVKEADQPRIELPLLHPDDTGSFTAIKDHAGLKAASSLPLSPVEGESRDPIPYVRQRSKSEVIPPWLATREVAHLGRELQRSRSASIKNLLESAFVDEGVSITLDDPLLRVAEQEIAEAFEVSEDDLNQAAERMLAQSSDLESHTEEEEIGEDKTMDTTRNPPRISHRWSNEPDVPIIITDL